MMEFYFDLSIICDLRYEILKVTTIVRVAVSLSSGKTQKEIIIL
jgi:hypothetical protein